MGTAYDRSAVHGHQVQVQIQVQAQAQPSLRHLRRILPDPCKAVVVVGFAAVGTPARALVAGARVLKMFGA